MRKRSEKGQAIILAIVAMGLVLLGALGLAIDGSSLYGQRQMAQSAADAAAQAGILSVFNGTNTGANAFGGAAYDCAGNATTPCAYAGKNGFSSTLGDTVHVDFPSAPTVGLDPAILPDATSVPVRIIRVTITRPVRNGLIRMLGAAATTSIKAVAAAAICEVLSPIPIIVLHPSRPDTTADKNGSFFINGGAAVGKFPIKILGGPSRSIQVNSASFSSITVKGGSTVDLSQAGPDGTGSDFGDYGGPSTYPTPGSVSYGSTGHWVFPASPIPDPLYWGIGTPPYVSQPTTTGLITNPPTSTINATDAVRHGCPLLISCTLYSDGVYTSGIKVKDDFALFKPGLYYLTNGGFNFDSNSAAGMATGFGAPAYPGFTGEGMLVFNSGNAPGDSISFAANAGSLPDPSSTSTPKAGLGIRLNGADQGLPYESILFFQDRTTTTAHTHVLQGGGAITLHGTIYLTNPWPHTNPDLYQTLSLGGNSGSTTTITGQIITDALEISGDAGIVMNLDPYMGLHVRKVALVK